MIYDGAKNILGIGINKIPVVNAENACTSGSTVFYLACTAIKAGAADMALVLVVEKMYTR